MTRPQPLAFNATASFLTLLDKEILRFKKIALQTIVAPILTTMLYLVVFGETLNGKMATFEGISYIQFLIPGLAMMTLLQNSFSNSASSLLQSKIMGSLVFIELPPISGLQLAMAFISASVVRGLIVGAGVLLVTSLWGVPPFHQPLWILMFAILGALIMASLGIVCGLWADKYDQMGAFQTFIIMPLTFLSGVFYSVNSLPEFWAKLSYFNPFFYLIDGFRYGFFSESDFSPWMSLSIVAVAAVLSVSWSTWYVISRRNMKSGGFALR